VILPIRFILVLANSCVKIWFLGCNIFGFELMRKFNVKVGPRYEEFKFMNAVQHKPVKVK
jgi:hypothetical protein